MKREKHTNITFILLQSIEIILRSIQCSFSTSNNNFFENDEDDISLLAPIHNTLHKPTYLYPIYSAVNAIKL